MKKFIVFLLAAASLLSIPFAAAQAPKSGAPPILQIFREDVKPGKAAAHAKLEAGWPAAFRKANFPYYYLALTTMTGPTEAWFINPYDSLGDMEKSNKMAEANSALQSETNRLSAADGEMINSGRTMLASFIPELSYRPEFKLGEYRYFMVDTIRVKPGHGKQFADLRKAVNAAHTKADLDEHMLVYYVRSGAPNGTFLIFQPAKTLAESDEAAKTHGEGSAYYAATGDEGRKQAHEFALNDVMFTARDWMAFSPAMSYVGPETTASAPEYWNPKPAMAATPTNTKKKMAKIN